MAEISATQDAGIVLADDLMRDRARQFVEFLDDEVDSRAWTRLMFSHKQITITESHYDGCSITSKYGS